jgi:multidrug efflux pump subunit AcrA (membrane-fusion protein)
VLIDEKDAGIAVPISALITFAGLEKVILVRDGKAVEQTIITGRRGTDWIEIVSGLRVGDSVVLNPGNLRTGQPVIIDGTEVLQTHYGLETSGP